MESSQIPIGHLPVADHAIGTKLATLGKSIKGFTQKSGIQYNLYFLVN